MRPLSVIICLLLHQILADSICDLHYCKCSKKQTVVKCSSKNRSTKFPFPVVEPKGKQISSLTIEGFYIPKLKQRRFSNLAALNELRIISCSVSSMKKTAFEGLGTLRTLDLRKNSLSSIKQGCLPTTLLSLTLSKNRLKSHEFLEGLKLRHLELSSNLIENISNVLTQYLYENASIDISNNPVKQFDKDVFANFPLKYLNLSSIPLGKDIGKVLNNAIVTGLELRNISRILNEISPQTWTFDPKRVEKMNLNNNSFTVINAGTFRDFRNLRVLHLGYGLLHSCHEESFQGLDSLEQLHIQRNMWLARPPVLNNLQKGLCFTPKLRFLNISHTGITILHDRYFYCLRNLEIFQAKFTGLWRFLNNAFLGADNLREVTVYSSRMRKIEPLAFNGTKLAVLDIANNMLRMKDAKFWDIPHLEKLYIFKNDFYLGKMPDDYFSQTPKLQILQMDELTSFYGFQEHAFRNLPNLKEISMNRLGLGYIDWTLFNGTNLQKLSVQANNIRMIDYHGIPDEIRKNLGQFDVTYNLFLCRCGLKAFRNWVCGRKTSNDTDFPNKGKYRCGFKGRNEHEVLCRTPAIDHDCADLASRNKILAGLTISTILIFIFVPSVVFSFYYQRYRIKYFFIIAKGKLLKNEHHPPFVIIDRPGQLIWYEEDYDYQEDLVFVINHMIPLFEERLSVRLMVKDRDFRAGDLDFAELIIQSIENSQRVILVISNYFCRQKWAQFAVNILVNKIVRKEHHQYPICILKEEILEENITYALGYLLAHGPKIKWPRVVTEEILEGITTELGYYIDRDVRVSQLEGNHGAMPRQVVTMNPSFEPGSASREQQPLLAAW